MKPFNRFIHQKGSTQRIISYSLRIILALLFVTLGYFSLLVSPVLAAAPSILPATLPTGQVNVSYNAALQAVGGAPPYTWTLISGSLPPGLAMNTSGVISGIPSSYSSTAWQFQVQVTDSTPESSTAFFSITVDPPPFSISTITLYDGEENASYSASITVSGGTSPYTWAIINGSLPTGLSLNSSNGYISGIPKIGTEGAHSFTVQVTDSSSPQLTAQRALSIFIEEGTFEPMVTIGTGLEAGATKVRVDGTQVASLSGGESVVFDLDLGSSRTVTVDEIVDHPSEDGVRFKAEDDSQVVSETMQEAFFQYYTEYELEVFTYPSGITTISGSGWNEKDSTIAIEARGEVNNDDQTKYNFNHWLLPAGTEVASQTLNYTVEEPGVITAYYDTYYRLTVDTLYGTVDGEGWYKAGTKATWALVDDTAPMEGILGFFQGKYRATTSSGTLTMDGPKVITILWEPDYLLPYILIPLVIVVVILAIVGFYFLLRKQQGPQPQPVVGAAGVHPYAPRPIPQQHTTVVMIENKGSQNKQLPGTKEQLIEKFAELLDKYEAEIKTSLEAPQTPRSPQLDQARANMISAPIPNIGTSESDVFDGEVVDGESTETTCSSTSKKLLRTVAAEWRQVESSTVNLPASKESDKESEEQKAEEKTGLAITWGRDLYHEWEIKRCTLPAGHKGNHKGEKEILYSLLNTVTVENTYDENQKIEPPSPHFTDNMPELEPDSDKIVSPDELPPDAF
jgi:hypothetical protein